MNPARFFSFFTYLGAPFPNIRVFFLAPQALFSLANLVRFLKKPFAAFTATELIFIIRVKSCQEFFCRFFGEANPLDSHASRRYSTGYMRTL